MPYYKLGLLDVTGRRHATRGFFEETTSEAMSDALAKLNWISQLDEKDDISMFNLHNIIAIDICKEEEK